MSEHPKTVELVASESDGSEMDSEDCCSRCSRHNLNDLFFKMLKPDEIKPIEPAKSVAIVGDSAGAGLKDAITKSTLLQSRIGPAVAEIGSIASIITSAAMGCNLCQFLVGGSFVAYSTSLGTPPWMRFMMLAPVSEQPDRFVQTVMDCVLSVHRTRKEVNLESYSNERATELVPVLRIDITEGPMTTNLVGEDFCPTFSAMDHQESAYLEVPARVKFSRLREWLEECPRQHHLCKAQDNQTSSWNRSKTFRLIEVTTRRLVEVLQADNGRYATLSYVWGTATGGWRLSHAWANFGLTDEKGLKYVNLPSDLPPTIEHALKITAELEIPYLWIDGLCIYQDDDSDKADQIKAMAMIYENAYVCLIAAAAADAETGIAGITIDRTVGNQATTIKVSGISNECIKIGWNLPDYDYMLKQGRWSKRGWTFQEEMLSTRRLFFTRTEVFLHCAMGRYREHHMDVEASTLQYHQHLPPRLCSDKVTLRISPQRHSFWDLYVRWAMKYSERSLSYDTDALNAFSGLWQLLCNVLNLQPDSLREFGVAGGTLLTNLLWRPRTKAAGTMERVMLRGQRLTDGEEPKIKALFPGWHWTSWDGPKTFEIPWANGFQFFPGSTIHVIKPETMPGIPLLKTGPMEKLFMYTPSPPHHLQGILPTITRTVQFAVVPTMFKWGSGTIAGNVDVRDATNPEALIGFCYVGEGYQFSLPRTVDFIQIGVRTTGASDTQPEDIGDQAYHPLPCQVPMVDVLMVQTFKFPSTKLKDQGFVEEVQAFQDFAHARAQELSKGGIAGSEHFLKIYDERLFNSADTLANQRVPRSTCYSAEPLEGFEQHWIHAPTSFEDTEILLACRRGVGRIKADAWEAACPRSILHF